RAADIIVVGAGSFGGWTALNLQKSGAKVRLIDAWGPGNARSTSGDESRGVRSSYGDRAGEQGGAVGEMGQARDEAVVGVRLYVGQGDEDPAFLHLRRSHAPPDRRELPQEQSRQLGQDRRQVREPEGRRSPLSLAAVLHRRAQGDDSQRHR